MRIYITYRGKIASRVAVRQSRKSHPHGSAYRARQVNNVLEIKMKSIFYLNESDETLKFTKRLELRFK